VQRYIALAPLNVYKAYKRLQIGKYKSPGFQEFDVCERGKKRHIKSTVISERVVQRCLCDNAIVPLIGRTFIYDNGASMKNKGYDFAIRRLTNALRKHYRKHGNAGYILVFDFSKFFDNVSHKLIKGIISKQFTDKRLIELIYHFIDMFGDEGLGLGSQISQVMALASANRLDHLVKERLKVKYYGRYMDDGYLIDVSKARLRKCLKALKWICEKLEIKLNAKKTQIIKLSHGFTWLKVRFYLTSTGKVVKKIYKRSITKQRQRLKKLFTKWKNNEIPFKTVKESLESWRSYARKFDAWHTIRNMEKLYNDLLYGARGGKQQCCILKSCPTTAN
jgi:retron-type reverse transcriptase